MVLILRLCRRCGQCRGSRERASAESRGAISGQSPCRLPGPSTRFRPISPIPTAPFIHLHLHTEDSLLDGAIRIAELMKKAERCKMPALATTDHRNILGAI